MKTSVEYDFLVIGGGFYGSYLASILGKNRKVLLIDKNLSLMRKASFANQTRIHEGPHYLKSMETAIASKTFSDKLKDAFPEIIVKNSEHYYVIPEENNDVSELEFIEKCEILRVPISKVDKKIIHGPHNVYNVAEDNYDPSLLRKSIIENFNFQNLEVKLSTYVTRVSRHESFYNITLKSNLLIV